MTIGTRIAALRKAKGYSQEYLAQEIGISRQAVHKWEKDETRPDTDNLILLAQLLGTTVEYIAVGDKQENKKKIPKVWTYIIAIIITALLTFIGTMIFIANRPVSFDAGACGGGFATAVFDQYADSLIKDYYYQLTRDFKDTDIQVVSITPVKGNHEVHYEGKAIYMSFDAKYTFSDQNTATTRLAFMGERKWIQQYEWRMVTDDMMYDFVYSNAAIPEKI